MIPLNFQEKLRRPAIFLTKIFTKFGLSSFWDKCATMPRRFFFFQSPYFKSLNPDFIIDIGANSGEFILNMRAAFPRANILAFEPLNKEYEKLISLTKKDKKTKIHQTALGAEKSKAQIHVCDFSPSSSIVNQTVGEKTEEIEVNLLDSYLPEFENSKNVLIKIDVEGYELEVLKGATKTLKKAKYLYLEMRTKEGKVGCSFDEIYEYLKNAGWNFAGIYDYTYYPDGKLSHFDGLFINQN